MKRLLLWLLVPAVLVAVGYKLVSKSESPRSSTLRAADVVVLGHRIGPVTEKGSLSSNPLVQLSGPSTVYVLQGGYLRLMMEVPAPPAGKSISVPLSTVDDGSRPLYWGATNGLVTEHHPKGSDWYHILCVICSSPIPGTDCCPKVP